MATAGGSSAEPEALKHSFSYLVNSIDTAALLSAALSRDLITDRQRTECHHEADPYKKAETFVGYLQRAVNADYDNYYTIVQILKKTGQAHIASRLRDELAHSFRSMQQPSASSSTDEVLVVPDALVKELADLRFCFAKLLHNYEKQLRHSPEAQEEFVQFLPRLFPNMTSSSEYSSFQSAYNKFIEEEVSLFNTHYLKKMCNIFPDDISAATKTLVDKYEQQLDQFMASTTVSQFKQLFPATATPSKLLLGKVAVKLKLKNKWGSKTLQDLTELVINFGVFSNAFYLSKVENGCIAVTWLCSTTEVKQLKMAIKEAAGSLQTMGVLQVFIGEEELVLECSHSATDPFSHKPVTVHLVQETDIDYQCPICAEPLTEPYLSVKCGHHLCQQCHDHLLSFGKTECPTCHESDVLTNVVLDRNVQRKVRNLKVLCSKYNEGCEWVGELKDLHDHLRSHKPVTVHLVHETDIDYQCPICTEPLTEPYLSIECGHHLCRQCLDRLLSFGKTECPTCRESDVLTNVVLDKNVQRKVRNLKVRCSKYNEGCEWVGELKDLHDHLQNRCVVAFPFTCFFCSSRYAHESEMREHSRHHCHERMISCENCGYYNTFTIVTEKHYPICPRSPIVCPNQHCPVEGLRRHQLEQHLNECSYQLVDCPNTGCSVQLPRGEMKLHTQQQHNLVLEETNQAVAITPATVSPQYLYNQAPMEFIISDFSEKKEANEEWLSSPFYTYNRGYRFRLLVYPSGYGTGSGTHLSVGAALMRGKYDKNLEWPFEGDIRVELLNWRADKNHHSYTSFFSRYTDPDGTYSSRVISKETATGLGSPRFISHTDLAPTTNTEYLRDDYLKLRVIVAVVYSPPLPHLTPAWQDSLSTTQSGAQFTISEYFKRKQFNNRYYSSPFTTSPQGYRLCLRVDANGTGSGEGSHLSIYAYIMKDQHDNCLQWPFTGTIIFELLNWLEDKGHYKKTLSIGTNNGFVRVSKGEYGNNGGYPQFISHSSLKSSTNPQYLYQDCICVKIQAIANN